MGTMELMRVAASFEELRSFVHGVFMPCTVGLAQHAVKALDLVGWLIVHGRQLLAQQLTCIEVKSAVSAAAVTMYVMQ
jgi:hypothetical protein